MLAEKECVVMYANERDVRKVNFRRPSVNVAVDKHGQSMISLTGDD